MSDIVESLREFMDNEARSCSMDFGCITPLYVYRMWRGTVAIEEIERAMVILQQAPFPPSCIVYFRNRTDDLRQNR